MLLMEPIPILLFPFQFLNLDARMVGFHGNRQKIIKRKPHELRMLLVRKRNCCLVPLAKLQDNSVAFRVVWIKIFFILWLMKGRTNKCDGYQGHPWNSDAFSKLVNELLESCIPGCVHKPVFLYYVFSMSTE